MPEAIPINRSDLRLSLWEVDPCFRCPVVGACLTHREQLSLLKKSANSFADAASYEIHETLVSATGSENHLSRRIDSLLQRKYARDAAENLALAPDAFVERFREALPSERMAAMLWVAAVRRDLDFEQKREIFGELHMAMHESLGGRLQAERKLERVEKESEALRLELRQAVAERRTLQKEMDVCRRELMQSQSALASAESDLNRLKGELEARKRQECDSAKA
ncbi:MAG: hypothetical protein LBP68_05665, partial [Acidobacteriota bacterium]|nr:hypothetical protein [Acidobacteriota bacterium]